MDDKPGGSRPHSRPAPGHRITIDLDPGLGPRPPVTVTSGADWTHISIGAPPARSGPGASVAGTPVASLAAARGPPWAEPAPAARSRPKAARAPLGAGSPERALDHEGIATYVWNYLCTHGPNHPSLEDRSWRGQKKVKNYIVSAYGLRPGEVADADLEIVARRLTELAAELGAPKSEQDGR